MNILLVEPKSSTIYPPLGLMKISTYHKLKNDDVTYVVGKDKSICDQFWDKIYITTVFTYDAKQAIDTIKFYSQNLFNFNNINIGGISASLMPKYFYNKTGIMPHIGLLNKKDSFLQELSNTDARFAYLKKCGYSIDVLPPDYSIFPENTKYQKILKECYILYSTKGCPNNCKFCAVKRLEPKYVDYIPLTPRIEFIKNEYGEKYGLVLLDNNVAASKCYDLIISEIIDLGFSKNDLFSYENNGRIIKKKKYVDFNQGVDARLMDEDKTQKMSSIAIRPLRLAFDNVKYEKIYANAVNLAIKFGIKDLSNYMLYNNDDSPKDLYKRMEINTRFKEKYPDIRIFSFPMRYSPIECRDRKHVGEFWLKRQIRAFQLILNATHGIVSHKQKYFNRAFGSSSEEFLELLIMPYQFIINRDLYEYNIPESILLWRALYRNLGEDDKSDFLNKISQPVDCSNLSMINAKDILISFYENEHANVTPKTEWETTASIFYKKYKKIILELL